MDLLNDIFCYIMSGVFLPVGHACSGARTFLSCQAIALFFCLSERWSWRMHAYAAVVAIIANIIRVTLTLIWILKSWPYFQTAHDLIGWICVGAAFLSIMLYHPKNP